MNYVVKFNRETTIRVAQFLEEDGDLQAAARVWWQMSGKHPAEREPRQRFADLAFEVQRLGSLPADADKSRALLRLMGLSFPTPKLVDAYFDNLRHLLASKPKRTQPGRLVLGMGSGRCGSTTLSSAMASVTEACATHENAPPLFWEPLAEQLEVHVRRFQLLRQHFGVVFDGAHWWLNGLDRMFGEFADLKAIGLWRETESCVQSMLNQKGTGAGSLNHWAAPDNGVWSPSPGDPWYPSYEVPASAQSDPDGAKRAMVTRYVTQYNESLKQAAADHPDRVLLVRTEELSDPATYARMSAFVGFEIPPVGEALNVDSTADGHRSELAF